MGGEEEDTNQRAHQLSDTAFPVGVLSPTLVMAGCTALLPATNGHVSEDSERSSKDLPSQSSESYTIDTETQDCLGSFLWGHGASK